MKTNFFFFSNRGKKNSFDLFFFIVLREDHIMNVVRSDTFLLSHKLQNIVGFFRVNILINFKNALAYLLADQNEFIINKIKLQILLIKTN